MIVITIVSEVSSTHSSVKGGTREADAEVPKGLQCVRQLVCLAGKP